MGPLGGAQDTDRTRNNKFYGVVVGIVTNILDPENLGRVKLRFPWLAADQESDWARIANLLAGNGYGSWFMPEVGAEVLVAFEHGDIRFPYVLGMLWNGADRPPQPKSTDKKEHDKVIKTRLGSLLVFGENDSNKQYHYIQQKVPASQDCAVQLDANAEILISGNKVKIKGETEVTIEAPTINIKADMLKCEGSTSVEIKGAKIDVKADGMLTLKGATVNIN